MLKRFTKILLLNSVVCLLFINIQLVFAYDFVDPTNEERVKIDRTRIYDLVNIYYDIMGANSSSSGEFQFLNYSGVCNTVTVTGNHAGTYSLEEYVAGVVKQEIGGTHPEAQKAQAVAARSYLLGQKKNSDNCTVTNGQSFQAMARIDPNNSSDQQFIQAAQETAGMVITRNGEIFITYFSSSPPFRNQLEANGKWYVTLQKDWTKATEWTWEGPPKAEVCSVAYCGMDGRGHVAGMSQIIAPYLAHTGQTFDQILELFYKIDDTYAITILQDGDYVGNASFQDSSFGQIRYFNQGDFGNYYYSSNVSVQQYSGSSGAATIASHGCGPTSLSIVLSSMAGRDISPITVTQEVCSLGGCSGDGSYYGVLKTVAEKYGYKAEWATWKEPEKVVNALGSGNSLVIALMGPGTFTSGGHYIVLTGTRSDGYVSVADPGSRSRTETKWFSFNLIVEQTKKDSTDNVFLVISK